MDYYEQEQQRLKLLQENALTKQIQKLLSEKKELTNQNETLKQEKQELTSQLETVKKEYDKIFQEKIKFLDYIETNQYIFKRIEAEQIKAEQLKAEQLKAEQMKAEQLKAEQLKAEQLKAKQLKAELLKAEQLKAEQLKAEQLKAKQLKAGQLKADEIIDSILINPTTILIKVIPPIVRENILWNASLIRSCAFGASLNPLMIGNDNSIRRFEEKKKLLKATKNSDYKDALIITNKIIAALTPK